MKSFKLAKKPVRLAVLSARTVLFRALIVLVHVLKFLFAFLGTSPVS